MKKNLKNQMSIFFSTSVYIYEGVHAKVVVSAITWKCSKGHLKFWKCSIKNIKKLHLGFWCNLVNMYLKDSHFMFYARSCQLCITHMTRIISLSWELNEYLLFIGEWKGSWKSNPGCKGGKGHNYEIYMINGKGYKIRDQLKRRGKGLCFSRNLGS